MDGSALLTETGEQATPVPADGLRVESVSFAYRDGETAGRPVLVEMDLRVRGSEIVVLLGPSGCGKSSLLTLVAGFHRPTSGRITLDGMEVTGPGPDRVMVFQAYTSFPWLTVLENVEFGLAFRGIPASDVRERARHCLEMVGLGSSADAYPHELSGGMRQRVAIARALAARPRLLLMDEPFGALDTHTKGRVQENLLAVLADEPMGVVFVTHDIEEALFLGDRIHLLTPRPARLAFTLEVPLERPRRAELRFEPEFVELRRDLIARFRKVHG
jgi:NitT/TauT family transport system ATP-binding protein/sulfonate transport system ATP-binding protein